MNAENSAGNLYFKTFPKYRKYPNMKSNPQASVVITQEPHTLQMDGTITELNSDDAEQLKKF